MTARHAQSSDPMNVQNVWGQIAQQLTEGGVPHQQSRRLSRTAGSNSSRPLASNPVFAGRPELPIPEHPHPELPRPRPPATARRSEAPRVRAPLGSAKKLIWATCSNQGSPVSAESEKCKCPESAPGFKSASGSPSPARHGASCRKTISAGPGTYFIGLAVRAENPMTTLAPAADARSCDGRTGVAAGGSADTAAGADFIPP